MASVTVKDNSASVKAQYSAAKKRSLEVIGLTAEGYAKKACPVDTGRLRNSITHETDEDAAYIGTNVEYAPPVEFGTIHQSAQPFLRPAATEHTSTYKRIIQDAFSEIK